MQINTDNLSQLLSTFCLFGNFAYANELRHTLTTFENKRDSLLSQINANKPKDYAALYQMVKDAFLEFELAYNELIKAFDYYCSKVTIEREPETEKKRGLKQ
jgi:hypothetical protein